MERKTALADSNINWGNRYYGHATVQGRAIGTTACHWHWSGLHRKADSSKRERNECERAESGWKECDDVYAWSPFGLAKHKKLGQTLILVWGCSYCVAAGHNPLFRRPILSPIATEAGSPEASGLGPGHGGDVSAREENHSWDSSWTLRQCERYISVQCICLSIERQLDVATRSSKC
jgi:hypothetical protein